MKEFCKKHWSDIVVAGGILAGFGACVFGYHRYLDKLAGQSKVAFDAIVENSNAENRLKNLMVDLVADGVKYRALNGEACDIDVNSIANLCK